MTINYDQPVPRRGGPNDALDIGAIAASVVRRAGDNPTPQKIDKAIEGALDAYVIIPRSALPNPELNEEERWRTYCDEGHAGQRRVDELISADEHRRLARAHLTLAGALEDDVAINAWRAMFGLRSQWANKVSTATDPTSLPLDYDELPPEAQVAVDALINAGLEP